MTPKLWVLLGLAAAVGLGWVFRYETIPVQAGRIPAAYVVNRWTGATYFMQGSTIREVQARTPSTGARGCGGIAAIPCPTGQTCVDDPTDTCDPKQGHADCAGICR